MIAYVNAYEVSRHYGGPEEGGWWYDAGIPIGSVPVEVEDEMTECLWCDGPEAERAQEDLDPEPCERCWGKGLVPKVPSEDHPTIAPVAASLRATLEPEHKTGRPISSVLGGTEVRIRVEDSMAAPWPESRPHYE